MSVISEDTVRGTFHQGDSSHFSDDTLGRQCMANAVAAAVYATMLPMNYWNPPAIDRILIAGDELYRRRCNHQYQYLQFSDIRDTEVLFGQQHDMNANAAMTGLLQYEFAPSPPFFTLDQAVSSMENSQQWTYGILTLADGNDGASVLLCVKQGNYYIFDSHSRDVFGNVVPNGTSVLLHMRTHNAFMKYIKTLGCQLAASQFEITVLSPSVSGFHHMLQQTPTSQKSQNEQSKQKIENKSSEIKRTSCRSTKQQNKEKKQHSQTSQNTEHMQKIQKKSSETRRITCNSTQEQNKEVKQHSDSFRHIKDINDKTKNKKEQKKIEKKNIMRTKKEKY